MPEAGHYVPGTDFITIIYFILRVMPFTINYKLFNCYKKVISLCRECPISKYLN